MSITQDWKWFKKQKFIILYKRHQKVELFRFGLLSGSVILGGLKEAPHWYLGFHSHIRTAKALSQCLHAESMQASTEVSFLSSCSSGSKKPQNSQPLYFLWSHVDSCHSVPIPLKNYQMESALLELNAEIDWNKTKFFFSWKQMTF